MWSWTLPLVSSGDGMSEMQGKKVVGGHHATCGETLCLSGVLWLLVTETHLENQPCVGGTDVLLYTHGAEQAQQPGRAGTRAGT